MTDDEFRSVFVEPIKKLQYTLSEVGSGNLTILGETSPTDNEISQLSYSVDQMILS